MMNELKHSTCEIGWEMITEYQCTEGGWKKDMDNLCTSGEGVKQDISAT